jgi:membrane fusion protein (multidrug efflux system)
MDVAITQRYVCHIHAKRHIDVLALETGYLSEIKVRAGQAVKKGDRMFKILPILNGAKLAADSVNVIAPFEGIPDRLEQLGSLVKKGDILATLSDNSVMWVYFNVPDQQYLEYMAARKEREKEDRIELLLPNQTTFPQPGKIGAIEGPIQHRNIAFRADFPNPDGLLRHGQTGTILIHRKLHDAIVIPMQATYEILDKRYLYVVDKDDVAHGREIVVQNEVEDIFVIKKGVGVGDRIVLEGIRQVRDGEKVEYEFRSPEEVMRNLKNHAE